MNLESSPQQQSIENSEIAELENPCQEIIIQLKNEIKEGAYSTLIGDDASGRVPALIFYNLLTSLYEKSGHQKPQILFMAGRMAEWENVKIEHLKDNVQLPKNKKALLITDLIHNGNTLRGFLDAFEKSNIEADIASIGCDSESFVKNHTSHFPNNKIAIGTFGQPSIYGKSNLSGVQKNDRAILAESIRSQEARPDVISARNDVKVLSDRLLAFFEKLE